MAFVYEIADTVGTGMKKIARNLQAKLADGDSLLLERAKNGDDSSFAELVRRHQNHIYRLAFGYLGEREAAKDTTQEVFLKAYQGLLYFQNDSQFSTWLYSICKNHCLNVLKRQRLQERIELPNGNQVENTLPLKIRLKGILAELKDEHREIIILRYYQDLKYDQIAKILNISMDTVKVRLFRAKAELKELMGEGLK